MLLPLEPLDVIAIITFFRVPAGVVIEFAYEVAFSKLGAVLCIKYFDLPFVCIGNQTKPFYNETKYCITIYEATLTNSE
jgi:hypothetical protein